MSKFHIFIAHNVTDVCGVVPRLEERQRAEKKLREAKKQDFTPRWFRMSGDVAPTPWGDLELYEYTGKFHNQESMTPALDVEVLKSVTFDPWQLITDHNVAAHGSL